VAKASYSRYYEGMYTSEYASVNQNSIQTGGVSTNVWLGDLNNNGMVDTNEVGAFKSGFTPKANKIDPNLKDPRTDEIMFAYQRELANNWSLNVDWIQRWFNDATIDQSCYGFDCAQTSTLAYTPATFLDFGPDNLRGTGDDRNLTFYNVPANLRVPEKQATWHTNCGNNTTIECTQKYRALELSVGKRMSSHWQMQTSYVWSRLDGNRVLDYTNPNNQLEYIRSGRGANDQPHAFKLLGSYQAPYGITFGANYQALSGLPRDRSLSVALAQGTSTLLVEPRGTYRADFLNLVSLRADKSFRLGGGHRLSAIVELHNAINSHAGQTTYGVVSRGNLTPAAFEAARAAGTSYFGRVEEIIAPRVLKIGFRFDF
jgi:hypothetical protein